MLAPGGGSVMIGDLRLGSTRVADMYLVRTAHVGTTSTGAHDQVSQQASLPQRQRLVVPLQNPFHLRHPRQYLAHRGSTTLRVTNLSSVDLHLQQRERRLVCYIGRMSQINNDRCRTCG